MNLIEIKTTCLKTDKKALYKDIFVDKEPFQKLLKRSYQKEFSVGRFKEIFIPCLIGSREVSMNFKDLDLKKFLPTTKTKLILPVYGCQDGCCVYVYLLISKKNGHITWEKAGRNTTYIRDTFNPKEKIEWLSDFSSLQFNETNYKNALHQLK